MDREILPANFAGLFHLKSRVGFVRKQGVNQIISQHRVLEIPAGDL